MSTDASFRYEHFGFYLIPAVFLKSVLILGSLGISFKERKCSNSVALITTLFYQLQPYGSHMVSQTNPVGVEL